jgi:hypothetical protein
MRKHYLRWSFAKNAVGFLKSIGRPTLDNLSTFAQIYIGGSFHPNCLSKTADTDRNGPAGQGEQQCKNTEFNIVKRALEEPMRQIAQNAGHGGAIIVRSSDVRVKKAKCWRSQTDCKPS